MPLIYEPNITCQTRSPSRQLLLNSSQKMIISLQSKLKFLDSFQEFQSKKGTKYSPTEHLPINLLTYEVSRCAHTALMAQQERPNISRLRARLSPQRTRERCPGTAASPAAPPRCRAEPRARPGPRSPESEQPRGCRSALSSPAAAGAALRAAGAAPAPRPRPPGPAERPRAPLALHGASRPRSDPRLRARIRREPRPDLHPRADGEPGQRRLLATCLGFVQPLSEPVHHHRGR